jgi:glycosyltransferase involved in cell wall biosynthesis
MLSVSVAMATYNGQNGIRGQLASIAEQTYKPSEIVITDDGSSDDTLSIVSDFAKGAPCLVRVYSNENRLGFRSNFMRAACFCQSDLIAFSDQDDIWYSNKIDLCVKQFADPDVLLAYHNADVVTKDGTRVDSLNQFAAPQAVMAPMSFAPMSLAPGFTQIFRRELLQHSSLWNNSQDHRSPGEPMAHDQWFFFLASILGKISYLSAPLAAYVQHGSNTVGHIKRPKYLKKIAADLQNPAQQLSRSAEGADARASLLEALKSHLKPEQGDRAEKGAARYRKLSNLNALRAKIYSSPHLNERLAAFAALVKMGAYGSNWKLSHRSLIKDLCIGIPIGSN